MKTALIIAALAALNLLSFGLMAYDKRCAKKGKWRVPERTLFLAAACFGGLGGGMGWSQIRQRNPEAGGERPEGSERGGMGGRPGTWNGQSGAAGENGTMPTPPAFDGEMPRPEDMPTPPDGGGMRPNFGDEAPDPSAMPEEMGDGQVRRSDAPDVPQNAAEESAELAAEEVVPPGPQPVSASFLLLVGGCALALALGILIAMKYRQ